MYVLSLQVEARLNDRTLRGQDHYFVILIPEGRTYAPRVADGKQLAAACHPAHHVASVKVRHRGLQDIGYLNMIVYMGCDVSAFQAFLLSF